MTTQNNLKILAENDLGYGLDIENNKLVIKTDNLQKNDGLYIDSVSLLQPVIGDVEHNIDPNQQHRGWEAIKRPSSSEYRPMTTSAVEYSLTVPYDLRAFWLFVADRETVNRPFSEILL